MAYQAIKSDQSPSNDDQKKQTDISLNELTKTEDETPGARIRAYRNAAGYSQRTLALKCDPPMDFTAIGRIERNQGYTSSTLNRLATALNCTVADFFLPAELAVWPKVREQTKEAVLTIIRNDMEASGKL